MLASSSMPRAIKVRVGQHGRHHRALLRVRFIETALELLQHWREGGIVPAFDARLEIQELTQDGGVSRLCRPTPERDIDAKLFRVKGKIELRPSRHSIVAMFS